MKINSEGKLIISIRCVIRRSTVSLVFVNRVTYAKCRQVLFSTDCTARRQGLHQGEKNFFFEIFKNENCEANCYAARHAGGRARPYLHLTKMTDHPATNYSRWQASTDRPSDQGKCFNTKEFQEKIEQAQNHVRKILDRNTETKCAHAYDDK